MEREQWASHTGMIAAMLGTAIGLGNIWRFPYLCGKNGGGCFIIPYMILLVGVALFAMMAEWALGRYTKREPLGAFERVGFPFGRDVGAWGIIGPFFLFSYYAVITSWVIFFVFASFGKLYFGTDSAKFFVNFLSSKWIFAVHIFVIVCTSFIIALGVEKGIERVCKIMIPGLFVLLIIIAVRALTLPGAAAGVEFYMKPRWEGIMNPQAWIDALGQVFFTLSLGMGAMLIYGSYLQDDWDIPINAVTVSLVNAWASILAGFTIFPAAFALGLGAQAAGEQSIGLTFIVLPKVFENMPAGAVFGGLFFILLAFGAFSSAISIQEPMVAWLKDEVGWSRRKAASVTGVVLWLLGLPFILNGLVPDGLGAKLSLIGKMDTIIGGYALPLFGFLGVIAVGWFMKERGFEEINKNARFKIGRWVMFWLRYVVPFFILLLFVMIILRNLGLLDKILPVRGVPEFTPTGIDIATVITVASVCLLIYGGGLVALITAITVERAKDREKRG